jgi:hypothetical protein
VPDFRGLFLRGYGSQSHAQENGSTIGVTSTLHSSGNLGAVQGDATRDIQGEVLTGGVAMAGIWFNQTSGAFSATRSGDAVGAYSQSGRTHGLKLDASRVTPTAGEIRPANTAVRYLIRALP